LSLIRFYESYFAVRFGFGLVFIYSKHEVDILEDDFAVLIRSAHDMARRSYEIMV
jgi:hypothetical protein